MELLVVLAVFVVVDVLAVRYGSDSRDVEREGRNDGWRA